jgi:hypothetical protein
MAAGCATLGTSDVEIARTCGIDADWNQLKRAPENSAQLLSLAANAKNPKAEVKFSPGSRTHQRWYGKGDRELAYCRYQVVLGSCDWPNQTVKFQKVDGRWSAELLLPTICVTSNP